MNIISASIDLLKLQGAKRIEKNGKAYVLIDLATSKAREHKNGSVYCELEIIENKDGENQWGQTHFLKERQSKEARQAGEKAAIIGNGKLLSFGGKQNFQQQQAPARQTKQSDEGLGWVPAEEDQEVPF